MVCRTLVAVQCSGGKRLLSLSLALRLHAFNRHNWISFGKKLESFAGLSPLQHRQRRHHVSAFSLPAPGKATGSRGPAQNTTAQDMENTFKLAFFKVKTITTL